MIKVFVIEGWWRSRWHVYITDASSTRWIATLKTEELANAIAGWMRSEIAKKL